MDAVTISKKWSILHARVRLDAATGNHADINRFVDELEREIIGEPVEETGDDAGGGVDSAGDEVGG